MSLLEKIGDNYDNFKDSANWHIKHASPIYAVDKLYNKFLDSERGLQIPYYAPHTQHLIRGAIKNLFASAANFVHSHELEINTKGKDNITKYRRIFYFLNHFYVYSNTTMSNIYYYSNAKSGHLQRAQSFYNYSYLTWFLYNVVSGAALVALTNFYLKKFKPSLPIALIGTVPLFAAVSFNYTLSDKVKNYFVNNTVRRLGYGHLTSNLGNFPRNVEFTAY